MLLLLMRMGWASKGQPIQNKKWPLISETTTGQKNVEHYALGDKSKIYLSPLHIMLDLIKNICENNR